TGRGAIPITSVIDGGPAVITAVVVGAAVIAAAPGWAVSGAAIGSASRGTAIGTAHRGTAHRTAIGGTPIGAVINPPREGVRHCRCRQQRADNEDGRSLHHFFPLPLADAAAATGFSSTCVAPAGSWKAKSASAWSLLKFRSENIARTFGLPGRARSATL